MKSKLALSLDKDDFVVNGYPMDARKHPFKPSAKGKERVPKEAKEEEEDEDDNDDEEFEDVGVPDVPAFHEEMRDNPS